MTEQSLFAPGRQLQRLLAVDREIGSLAAGGGGCLVATFVLFVLNSTLAVVPLAGFLAVTGYGWYAHQAETARALTFLATVSTILILGLITVYVFIEALPVLQRMGVRLFGFTEPVEVVGVTLIPSVDSFWSTSQHTYSLIPMIWGRS